MKHEHEEIYNRYVNSMRAVCRRYIHSEDDVEDILQEGFIKVFLNLKKFKQKDTDSLRRWIKTIMINTCLSFLKKQSKKTFLSSEEIRNNQVNILFDESENRDHRYMSTYELVDYADFSKQELMETLQNLPKKFGIIFYLHVIEGYKHQEIAKMLSLPENTCRTRLNRARNKLKKVLYEKSLAKLTIGQSTFDHIEMYSFSIFK